MRRFYAAPPGPPRNPRKVSDESASAGGCLFVGFAVAAISLAVLCGVSAAVFLLVLKVA